MKITTTCCLGLLMISSFASGQKLAPQSNPPCAGVSASAYVNWAQFGFDTCHTGFNPNEIILGPSNVRNLAAAWTFQTSGGFLTPPAVANEIVYVGGFTPGYLYALNAKTGSLIWKFALGDTEDPTPVVVNGVVYINTSNSIYALRAGDGTLLWTYTTGQWVGIVSAVDGVVYFGGGAGVYALNANTGALIWKSPNIFLGHVAVANGVVYANDYGGQLHAYNANTGALLWISDFYDGNIPVVANGIVYLGTEGGSPYGPGVIALRADTGAFLWNFQTQKAIFNDPAVAYGTVYLQSDGDSYLYALDARTGELLWAHYNSSALGGVSPVAANGVVYTVSWAQGAMNIGLQAIDARTGQFLWQDASLLGPAIVANGWIYATDGDRTTYAFHLPGH